VARDTKIITYLTYTELFDTFKKNGILLSSNSLKKGREIESQIEHLLEGMDPIELIKFSSFLNMICQSVGSEMTMIRGVSLLKEARLVPQSAVFSNKILFHRDNLLNLIGQILDRKINGTEQLTGPGQLMNKQKYTRSLLWNNDSLNIDTSTKHKREAVVRDHFIREWPHYYISETAEWVYRHRIIRYRYCYETALPALKEPDRVVMEGAIRAFENLEGVSLGEYMHATRSLFSWFLEWPLYWKKTPPKPDQPKYGFDFQNINTFYINSSAFEGDPAFIKTIEVLAKDIGSLKKAIAKEAERSRDVIVGYNKYARVFFDNPIFKISDGNFCVIDLKFVIENVCGGLMWRLKGLEDIQRYKASYGLMLEEYFHFLIRNIFKGAKITFGEQGGADAIIEKGNNIIVMEFTTEFYRLMSLYTNSLQEFIDDAYRLLFNSGIKDPLSRDKKDKGKLIKLDKYLETSKQKGKTIIPVLVTENLFGNPNLFNEFSSFYDKQVAEKGLTNIKKHKPIFLCLDDLETFWGFYESRNAVKDFVDFSQEWELLDKGPFFHNATAGIIKHVESRRGGEARILNKDYAEFFSTKRLYKK